ncbi:MAG: hypothetical protein JWP88_211 [Flaviaesturariibacter sp.]|nr:hypothetical protein [Flaviaesturariibacter sp.]
MRRLLDAELPEAKLQELVRLSKAYQQELDFVITLTPLQRKRLYKLDYNRRIFVQRAVDSMTDNPTILPSYLKPEHARKDMTLYQQLCSLETQLEGLVEQVKDARLLAGNQALSASRIYYKHVQEAAKAGVEGMEGECQRLKDCYGVGRKKGSGKKTEKAKDIM